MALHKNVVLDVPMYLKNPFRTISLKKNPVMQLEANLESELLV